MDLKSLLRGNRYFQSFPLNDLNKYSFLIFPGKFVIVLFILEANKFVFLT